MLKWLRTGAWSKLTDVLTAIRQELQSVQPIDTASIRWEKDAEGMKAYYTGRTGGGEGLTVDEGGESVESEGSSYNGYFTIKLKVVDGDSYVVVCDGATWDSESETSGGSLLHLNQVNYWIPLQRSLEPITSTKYVVVYWKDAIEEDLEAEPPIEAVPELYGIDLLDTVPDDSYTEIYRIVGRVIVSGETITVQQDHVVGVLYATAFTFCTDPVYKYEMQNL